MELSKEDLEKIIKGVAEVIGVKKENKNMEEIELISKLKGRVRVFGNQKKIIDEFYKSETNNFITNYGKEVLEFLQFKINNDEKSIKFYDTYYNIDYKVEDKDYIINKEDNQYEKAKVADYDNITEFYDKYIPNKAICFWKNATTNEEFRNIKEIIEHILNPQKEENK